MNESPAPPISFQDSIPAHPFNPIVEGMKKGAVASISIAVFYALTVPLLFSLMNPGFPSPTPPATLQDGDAAVSAVASNYGSVLMVGGLALVAGGIPALVFGIIGGGVIGVVFRYYIRQQVSSTLALLYGFWISLAIVSIRFLMLIQRDDSPFSAFNLADPLFWVMVMGPMIGAFLGFWWVAYQVNSKMPQA